MSEVTAIEPQKRKAGRFNIFVDGSFAFGLDEKILAEVNLKVGQKITQAKIEKLISEYGVAKILAKVLNFLSFRPRSKKEISNYLKKKNLGEKEIDEVLKKLERLKFIDDEEFVKFWIKSRTSGRPKGKRLIFSELIRKGIDRELIEKFLAESDLDEAELARKALEKKLKIWQKLSSLEFRQKAARFLASRGFDWETIKKVIEIKPS